MLEINLIDEMEKQYGETLEERLHPDVAAGLRENYMRAILLNTPPRWNARNVMRNSWFYGEPTLPEDTPWPVYTREGVDYPMSFVLQLDCADVPRLEEYPFPEKGVLLFFHEFNFQMERSYNKTFQLGSKVIYLENVTNILPRQMPEIPEAPFDMAEGYGEYHYWDEGHLGYRYIRPARIEPIIFGDFDDFMQSSHFKDDRAIRMIYSNAANNARIHQNELLKNKLRIRKRPKWGRHKIFGISESYFIDSNNEYKSLLHLFSNEEMKFFNEAQCFYIKNENLLQNNFDNVACMEGW